MTHRLTSHELIGLAAAGAPSALLIALGLSLMARWGAAIGWEHVWSWLRRRRRPGAAAA